MRTTLVFLLGGLFGFSLAAALSCGEVEREAKRAADERANGRYWKAACGDAVADFSEAMCQLTEARCEIDRMRREWMRTREQWWIPTATEEGERIPPQSLPTK